MRGGKREGAGRKALYQTTTMRIPTALKSRFETLIAEYKRELLDKPAEIIAIDSVTTIKLNEPDQQNQGIDVPDNALFDSVTESNDIDHIALFRQNTNRKQRKIVIKQFGSEAAAARHFVENAILMG